jgi:hypothetical protein
MATARQSRAARGAQAAAASKTNTVVPISGAGRNATGDNGGGRAKPAATAKPASKPAATAKPAAQPKPTVTVTEYQKTFYRPTVNGKPVECEHDPSRGKYGHDSAKAALACGRRIAAGTAA